MTEKNYNQRRACALAGLDPRVYRRRPSRPEDQGLRQRLKELSGERRRFGYRRLHILLNREGWKVNWKKLYPCMVVSERALSVIGPRTMPSGTELTSNAILQWQEGRKVEWHYIAPGKPMQNGFVESFMYRRPRGRKCFERDLHRPVRSCIRPVCAALYMTAGPDGVRGSRPHQRDALWRA